MEHILQQLPESGRTGQWGAMAAKQTAAQLQPKLNRPLNPESKLCTTNSSSARSRFTQSLHWPNACCSQLLLDATHQIDHALLQSTPVRVRCKLRGLTLVRTTLSVKQPAAAGQDSMVVVGSCSGLGMLEQ